MNDADNKCPECGSTNSRCYSVIDYKDGRTCELQCRDCGKYFQHDEDDKEG